MTLRHFICVVCVGIHLPAQAQSVSDLILETQAQSFRAENMLSAGDTISVDVQKVENLSGPYEIGVDGVITFPLIGELTVTGMTTFELADRLMVLYEKDYLVDPLIRVKFANPDPDSTNPQNWLLTYEAEDTLNVAQENMSPPQNGHFDLVIETDVQDIKLGTENLNQDQTPLLNKILARAPHTGILKRDTP